MSDLYTRSIRLSKKIKNDNAISNKACSTPSLDSEFKLFKVKQLIVYVAEGIGEKEIGIIDGIRQQ